MATTAMNLLIVDDEPSTRSLLSQIFVQLGHTVSSAGDGFSALEQIRQAMPDVIVSDLNMPGMSGFELLSVVRRRLPAIYVIATSGAYSGKDVPDGIAADAFYEKASGFSSLLTLMKAAAETKESTLLRANESAPIWISRTDIETSEDANVTISCPECLRTFPQRPGSANLLIHEAECPYCSSEICFAIVQPLDPLTSQPYSSAPLHVPSDRT